jgi:hypothetical protein
MQYGQMEQSRNIAAFQGAFGRSDITAALTRGACRLLLDMGFEVVTEFTLPNQRRADIIGLDRKGRLLIAEVKSCPADFKIDQKWQSYRDYCDFFYFVTEKTFPAWVLPPDEGRIVADAYGGAIETPAIETVISAVRRKTITLGLARNAAHRLYVSQQS